jgi:hypothetical protein
MRFAIIWTALAGIALPLSAKFFYVGDKQYRYCTLEKSGCRPGVCQNPNACNAAPAGSQLPVVEQGDGFKTVYIEFNDRGQHWEQAQLDTALWVIDQQRKTNSLPEETHGGPVVVFLYVHGWKNNANEIPGEERDVEKFRDFLKGYVTQTGRVKPVVGVYLAWHGRSLDLPGWISWVSFWTRSFGARRAGSGKLGDDIVHLVNAAKRRGSVPPLATKGTEIVQTRQEDLGGTCGERARHSQVVVLSHSFGARVLETALIGRDTKGGVIRGTCKQLALTRQPDTVPIDLVVYSNAATGGAYIWRQFVNCQACGNRRTGCNDVPAPHTDYSRAVMARSPFFDRAACRKDPSLPNCQPYPLFVSVSGKNDVWTRLVLTIAAGQHPAAFLPWLQTHTVQETTSEARANPANDEQFTFEVVEDGNQKKHTYIVKRKNLDDVYRTNPIWTMAVDKRIINGHGGVWAANYINLLLNMMGAAADCGGTKVPGYDPNTNRVRQMAR